MNQQVAQQAANMNQQVAQQNAQLVDSQVITEQKTEINDATIEKIATIVTKSVLSVTQKQKEPVPLPVSTHAVTQTADAVEIDMMQDANETVVKN
jgi:hypothetical protein